MEDDWSRPEHEGNILWLDKDKRWKFFWFKLKAGVLFQFEYDKGECVNRVILKDVSLRASPSQTHPFAFELAGSSSSSLYCALAADEYEVWQSLLKPRVRATLPDQSRPPSPRILSTSPTSTALGSIQLASSSTTSGRSARPNSDESQSFGSMASAVVDELFEAHTVKAESQLPANEEAEDLVSQMLEGLKDLDLDNADDDKLLEISEALEAANIKSGYVPTLPAVGEYYEEEEREGGDISPRSSKFLSEAGSSVSERKHSRSIAIMNKVMDEIDEDDDAEKPSQADAKSQSSDKTWRSVRRTVKLNTEKSSKIKGLSSTHRTLSPEQITTLREVEERARIVRLKKKLISKNDPKHEYKINTQSFGKGVGEVFFGTRVKDGKKVAIKQLEIIRRGRDRLPLILREIEIISTSQHPNIVAYYGSYEVGEFLWVVMEYMSGGSLYDIVKHYPNGVKAREEDCAYVVQEVTKALAFMHSQKRIHRDIKVDNILLDMDGSVKLADFGTAVQLTFQRLRRNTLAGTPYYMAPELIQRLNYKEKVDVWSLGITVVEVMTGCPPFYDLDPQAALDAIVQKGVVGLQASHQGRIWTPEIIDFVNNKCLHIDPDRRPSCESLLKHPFLLKSGNREDFRKVLAASKVDLEASTGSPEQHEGCSVM